MRLVEIVGVAAALVTVLGGFGYAVKWTFETDFELKAMRVQINRGNAENASLRSELAALHSKVAELENSKGNRLQRGSYPPVDEVAAILVRDYSDKLRGPQGEKGDPGPTGPRGESGDGSFVSASNAMTAIDFSKVSSGIVLDGIEWGTPKCKRRTSKVICEALVKNDSGEDNSSYSIYLTENDRDTRAYTDMLTQNKIAGMTSKSWSKKYNGRVDFKFPSGIVYPLKWEVLNVPKEANGFTRMDIDTEDGIVKYKNIPILN